MANEAKTDIWVNRLLTDAGIELEPQQSSILEINSALKTASKRKTRNIGRPEFIGIVKDFLIVIEDKPDYTRHEKLDDKGLIDTSVGAIQDYAVNGVLHYAKHLAVNTSYKKSSRNSGFWQCQTT